MKLVRLQIRRKQLTERGDFFKNLGLSEVIGGRESKKLVCNSHLLWI